MNVFSVLFAGKQHYSKWLSDVQSFTYTKLLHVYQTPLWGETCTSMRGWRGTNFACVQMGHCSECRSNTPTWAAKRPTIPVEQHTDESEMNTTGIHMLINVFK